MNTNASPKRKTARVAIDVRLYFDVPISGQKEEEIRHAAYAEFERVEEGQRIRVKKLRFPNLYLLEEWSDLSPEDFHVCEQCSAKDANADTRFSL